MTYDRKADIAASRNDERFDLSDAVTEELLRNAALPAEEAERAIRARHRLSISWLKDKPWLAGRGLAREVTTIRRRHTASIARSRAQGDK